MNQLTNLDSFLQPVPAFPSTIWKCGRCGVNLKGNEGEVYCKHCGALNSIPRERR
jgi:rubrerythrin